MSRFVKGPPVADLAEAYLRGYGMAERDLDDDPSYRPGVKPIDNPHPHDAGLNAAILGMHDAVAERVAE